VCAAIIAIHMSSIRVLCIHDPGDDLGFAYSHSNPNGTEFLARKVPYGKLNAVGSTMNSCLDER
jgi:hypothetical protein